MTCQKIKENFADFLVGDLDEKTLSEVRAHLAGCSSCRLEMENLSAIWAKLGVLPQEQPSPALRDRFYSMLEAYQEGKEETETRTNFGRSFFRRLTHLLPPRPVFQFGLALVFLAVGLAGGYVLNRRGPAAKNEIASLRSEIAEMHQTIAMSMLKQPSASDRLMGVSWSARLVRPDEKLLEMLLDTLNHDPNVNVRLAAIDALYLFYDNPRVKEGLVDSLAGQASPLVQLSLINLLVEIRERRAAEALERLIQSKKLNPKVKQRAELVLAQLT
jgi:hypothetical protein